MQTKTRVETCASERDLRELLRRGAEVGSETLDEFRVNRGLADMLEVAGDLPREFEGYFSLAPCLIKWRRDTMVRTATTNTLRDMEKQTHRALEMDSHPRGSGLARGGHEKVGRRPNG